MHKRSRFGLCFELIPTTGKAHRRLGDNYIILWPSYGNGGLLLWRKYEYYGFQRRLRELHGCHGAQASMGYSNSLFTTFLGEWSIELITFTWTRPALLLVEMRKGGRFQRHHWTETTEGGAITCPDGPWRRSLQNLTSSYNNTLI